jgi:oligoendopeptidase F
MRAFAILVGALTLGSAPTEYRFDFTRLFPTEAAEQTQRVELLQRVDAFEKQSAPSLDAPATLLGWLATHDSLCKELQRHETYVYLRAEQNQDDGVATKADAVLSDAINRVNSAVERTLTALDYSSLQKLIQSSPALAPYTYFIDATLTRVSPEVKNAEAARMLAQPALESLRESYVSLRRRVMQASSSSHSQVTAKQRFDARFSSFAASEAEFAALLIPIVTLENGKARLQGFTDAPQAAYHRAGLSGAAVSAALGALRKSDSYKHYESVVAAAAAQRLQIAATELHAWDLEAADTYRAPTVSFPEAVQLILTSAHTIGSEYALQYARLLDPANGRVEWCRSDKCDDSGFSVGYAGMTSGLFYGAYRGTTDNIRAVAHEAGHAVHRQLMSENQPLAVYNSGPAFMFESFAIFNDLLLLDHLYQTSSSSEARAYYLRQFLEDATHNVYGSAAEVDLEQSIYASAQGAGLRRASDLDELTLTVLARYMPSPTVEPQMQVAWARNRLYFTEPLYDVNYLFAGLLALDYLHQFEINPKRFASRYMALLKNGFTNSPQWLEKTYLGIDIDNTEDLVRVATALMENRASILKRLYDGSSRARLRPDA